MITIQPSQNTSSNPMKITACINILQASGACAVSVSPRSQGQGNLFKVTGDVDILMLFVESFGTPLYKKLRIWQKVP